MELKELVSNLTQNSKTLQARIVSGSIVLLSGSGLATAINLAYNVAIARFLGPTGYGHATVVYTLLTLVSAVTLSFQIISAKVVAQQISPETRAAAYRGFHRSAWSCGILVALILLFFQDTIADYLNLPGPVLVALLAIGAAFYVPLGSRRGYVQGTYGFSGLAFNLVLEGAVRLGGSFLSVLLGFGVQGVIAANAAAIAVAYFAIAPRLAGRVPNPLRLSYAIRETSQALVFFSGQVLINNCDIVLVKHFFPPNSAGLYAAAAMVGRVIYAFSSAVVNTMFPLVAGTRDEERKDLKVIATSLLLVLGVGSALSLGLYLAPAGIWTAFFGSGFEIVGKHNLAYLLAFYAITTVVYSLSVVIITFEMSYKIANTSYVQLAFSALLISAICRFHSSLSQVIQVQFVLMIVLFVFVAFPFLVNSLTYTRDLLRAGSYRPLRLIRRVAEDEVIAEFLKSDFHYPVFREYRESMYDIVVNPNLADPDENAKRRALLFLRHLSLWKEIPTDTQWFEIELGESDVEQIRVFPRAQWRKLGRGSFSMTEILKGMHVRQHTVDAAFLSKIASIRERLLKDDAGPGAIVLIGLSEKDPLTVLDGNHRLVSAMLESPNRLHKLRFMCGLSPRMSECCWYNTNVVTLLRYARNVLTHVVRDPEADLARLLHTADKCGSLAGRV
jgi:O-antigen/teichoic acid export membrane protein